jgi:hypothetical protein
MIKNVTSSATRPAIANCGLFRNSATELMSNERTRSQNRQRMKTPLPTKSISHGMSAVKIAKLINVDRAL